MKSVVSIRWEAIRFPSRLGLLNESRPSTALKGNENPPVSILLLGSTLRSPPAISTAPSSWVSSEEGWIEIMGMAAPSVLTSPIRRYWRILTFGAITPVSFPSPESTGSCKVGVGETKSTEEIDLILGSQNFDGSDVGHEIGHENNNTIFVHSLE